jgi:heme o synthase
MSINNSNIEVTQLSFWATTKEKIRDYGVLVKFKLNITVVISAVFAYFIALRGDTNWFSVCVLFLGGFFVTGAANALNQVLERDFDVMMERTKNRPLITGRMSAPEAILVAGIMSLIGIGLLSMFNILTAVLGMISLVLYSFVYTPFKRVSPIAVMIGAIPGALPTMIGAVAEQGHMTHLAITLFALQFFWQFPHFWAIAWLADEDYKKAGFNLLPSASGQLDSSIGMQATVYALFLIPIGILPYTFGATGLISAVAITILSLVYAFYGWKLYKNCDRIAARQLMFCSFFYLPLSLLAMMLDKVG